MSQWLVLVGFAALGGALIVWHAISHQKHVCELLLDQYAALLAAAREQRQTAMLKEKTAQQKGEATADIGSADQPSPE